MIIKKTIKSDTSLIPEASQTLFEALKKEGIDEDALFKVRLSFEEALANAIKHGNKNDKNKDVIFTIEASSGSIVIEVKDQGCGFDWRNTPLPTIQQNIEKLSGRGVFLIRELMDEVKYFDGGSRIKMVKSVNVTAKNRSNH